MDNAKNLTTISAGGNITYTYDVLNRLSTVHETNTGTTTYTYDSVGNLANVTYPNGVVHTYTYDNRNRLNNLAVDHSSTHLASYAYTLDFAGHRTGVTELSGRTATYAYDNIYRLTSETIASDPASINGTVGYTYDAVGKRTALTSTVASVTAGTTAYDANDRFTAGDTYDNDGNTVSSGGLTDVYDFENHLIQQGGVTVVYDGDGNRVSKTVAGATTTYLVDTVNPTGYAQVLLETGPNNEPTQYVYGLERISMREFFGSPTNDFKPFYYIYDGHGSVRALTGSTGSVTDTYDYDAFGVLLHSSGTTPNNYLYSGEQYDSDLHLYYNRARYLNVSTGRFWSMDTFEGLSQDPPSLHKYLYVGSEPINHIDPSGHEELTLGGQLSVATVAYVLVAASVLTLAYVCVAYAQLSGGEGLCGGRGREDDDKITLWHYTEFPNVEAIQKDGFLKPSLAAISSVYGQGQYLTDISPQEAGTVTKEQFLYAIYKFPLGWSGTDVGYLELRISKDSVEKVSNAYGPRFPGKSFYLRKSQLNLIFGPNSGALLVAVGKVTFQGSPIP